METKICPKCHEEKPANTTFFNKNKSTKDGLSCYCKECLKIKSARYYLKEKERILRKTSAYQKRKMATNKIEFDVNLMRFKSCNKCKKLLSLSHYSKENCRRDKLSGICKNCSAIKSTVYRQKKPEKRKEYYQKTKEHQKLKEREYRIKNRDKVNETKRNYRKNNPIKMKEKDNKEVTELRKNYIVKLIKGKNYKIIKTNDIPLKLIEIKRKIIQIKRKLN